MTSGDSWSRNRSGRARKRLAAVVVWPTPCHKCGKPVERDERWHLDHDPPRKVLPEWQWDDPRFHHVSHGACNMREGARLAHLARGDGLVAASFERAVPTLPRWWPADCGPHEVGAVWPAVWSGIDPRAVGTLGPQMVAWVLERTGVTLSWWQRFVCATALQVDVQGRLILDQIGVSTARQVGKSWLLRALALWRMSHEDLFGEPQLVLSVANGLNTAEEVFNPALWWADAQEGYRAFRAGGRAQISFGESRWLPRSTKTGFGFSVSMALCDEVWSIDPDVVWQMLEPTMVARQQPQIWLFSTAHKTPTPLWGSFVRTPQEGRAVIMWAADGDLDVTDVRGWQQASPVWTPQRERMITRALGSVDLASFQTQWLNRWPAELVERWLPLLEVQACVSPVGPVRPTVGALDCAPGGQVWSAARGELHDGRVVVEVLRTNVLQEALAWLARVPTVLMSRTVAESIPEGSVSEDPITVHVEIAATDRFAQSVRDREISLPRHPALLEQITAAKVRAVPSGNKVDSRHSGDTDLLRCVMWVNHRLSRKGKRSFNIVVSPR